jgi:hypothetical protein
MRPDERWTLREDPMRTQLIDRLADLADLTDADRTVERLYRDVVEVAWHQLPECDGSTLTVRHPGGGRTELATHPDLAWLETARLRLDEGPGSTAERDHVLVVLPDTLAARRWPHYCSIAAHHGVRCVLATAFPLPDGPGVLQLYSVTPGRLTVALETELTLITSQTRLAARNVLLYRRARAHAAQMRAARESSAVIEEAKGILMHAFGCDADAAFNRLRAISQQRQVKVATVAHRLVRQVASGHHPPAHDPAVRGS